MFPALEGKFLTTGPPGKSLKFRFFFFFFKFRFLNTCVYRFISMPGLIY